jgi:hypothetical protein
MIPRNVEHAIYGLVSTPVLYIAAKHGIFACLVKDGALTAPEVADRLSLDHDSVERLLLALVGFGIVERSPDGAYALDAETAPLFDPNSARDVGGFVAHLLAGVPGRTELLEEYLIRGKAVVDADRPTPYQVFYRDEESTQGFMDAMWHLSHGVSHELVRLADLGDARTLIDVGGAGGPFSVAALQAHPDLRATVFDLPDVGPHLARSADAHGMTERLGFVAGDFFRDQVPSGDVIALGYVMSNWPDAECLDILRNSYRACVPGGRILLMERLFDDDRHGPLAASVMNLLMQVETRGRHRTADEYVGLLEAAGFTRCEVHRSTEDKHLVIGSKAATDA